MNKGMKILSTFVVVVIISVIAFFHYLDTTMCENTEINKVQSPDKKMHVVLFERSCGATTGFSTQISLLNANKELTNTDSGNIYIAKGYPENYSFKWVSPYVLNIAGTSESAIKKVDLYNSVKIYYE